MKLPFRTLAGLLMGFVLVMLFYTRLAEEAVVIAINQLQAQQKATQKARQLKAKAQRDSTSEAHWRTTLIATALSNKSGGGAGKDSPVQGSITRQGDGVPNDTTAADATTIQRAATPLSAASSAPLAAGSGPVTSAEARLQVEWLLPLLALLGGLALILAGWLAWQEQAIPFVEPQPTDVDRSVLRALLGAYAGEIGRLLPIPRQVKRFASKARLQNNLLAAKARQAAKDAAPALPGFVFKPTQQILAFLLLLLIEQHPNVDPQEDGGISSADREKEFDSRLKDSFKNWHGKPTSEKAYYEFLKLLSSDERAQAPEYKELFAKLNAEESGQLFVQLFRLNSGLLV
jgi:hypothetical protein